MAKNKNAMPLPDDELVQLVQEEVAAADYSGTNELSFQREQSTRAYNGVLTDGLQPTTGMSAMLDNKVQPAVDTLVSHVARPFISDMETVIFQGVTPEVTPAAEQLTKIVNHIIHKQNCGSSIIPTWLKDAAINKNSVIKTTWDDTPRMYKEIVEGSEEAIDAWVLEKENDGATVEIISKEKITDTIEVSSDETDEVIEVSETYYRVEAKCSHEYGKVALEILPPEEFLINEGAKDINGDVKTRFVCQRQVIPVGKVQEMFPDVNPEDLAGAGNSGYLDYEYERLNRHAFDGTFDYTGTDPAEGPNRLIEVIEAWIRADRDGDGVAELRHVFVTGNHLLMDEEWFGEIPFSSYTFFDVPHKFYGLSVYDRIQYWHRAATMMLRSEIDTRLQQNTYRVIADPSKIDIRDLQSGRPGIIKAKPGFEPNDIQIMPAPSGAGNTLTILQYVDQQITAHLGISPVTGTVSTDIEKSGNDAAKTAQVVDAASNRTEAYARRFADGALREVVWQIAKLVIEHHDAPGIASIVEKVTPGIPLLIAEEDLLEYFDKDDLTAKVGLGFQTQQQKLQGAQAILQAQAALEQSPIAPTPIPYGYKQAANIEMTRALGFENAEKFFPSIEEVEAEQQRVQEQQAAQLQAQQQAQAQQMQLQERDVGAKEAAVQAKLEAEAQKIALQAEQTVLNDEAERGNKEADNARADRNQEAQEEQMAANIALQEEKLRLEREIAELKAQTELEKQRMADERTVVLKRQGGE